MSRLPGTSWVLMHEERSFIVPLAALGLDKTTGHGPLVVQHVVAQLMPVLEKLQIGAPHVGRVVTQKDVSEGGVFFDNTLSEGTALCVRFRALEQRVTVHVGRSSKLMRAVTWCAMGAGLAGGFAAMAALVPAVWDSKLRLASSALGALAGLLLAMVAVGRATWLASGRSEELTARLVDGVERWAVALGGSDVARL